MEHPRGSTIRSGLNGPVIECQYPTMREKLVDLEFHSRIGTGSRAYSWGAGSETNKETPFGLGVSMGVTEITERRSRLHPT